MMWLAFRVPVKGDHSGFKQPSWDKELNLAIQKIAEDLPTPWDPADCEGFKKLEAIAADSMARLAAIKSGEGSYESIELCAS